MKKFTNKMRDGIIRVQNAIGMRMAGCEMESGDHLIEVLGTIIIAAFLLFLFRGKISEIFNNALGKTANNLNSMF